MANQVSLDNAKLIGTGGAQATGLAVWTASKSYAVGDRTISPSGRLIVCRIAHTSGANYDARKWTYPGEGNQTIVDYTLLPDGSLSTAEPTVGSITSWGVSDANVDQYVIKDGCLQDWRVLNPSNPAPVNGYFTIYLPDITERIKHFWVEYDIATVIPVGQLAGVTLILQSPYVDEATSGIAGGVHNQLYSVTYTQGNTLPDWPQGGYAVPANPTFSSATITGGTNQVVISGVANTIVPGLQLIGIVGGTFLNNPSGIPSNIVLITGQVSGTPGGSGTYTVGVTNTGTDATATGFFAAVDNGPVFKPANNIIGKRIRVEFVIDHETGAMYGYINGLMTSHWVNPGNTAYCSYKAMLQQPGSIYTKTRQFGASAYFPEFYTSDRGRLPYRDSNGYFAFPGPNQYTLTSTWQFVYKIRVGFGFSGIVEVTWNPLVFCTSGSVYIELSSATVEPPASPNPCKVAEATTKCRVAFSQYYRGTPGSTTDIAIWAKTDGTATLGDPIATGGRSGGASWRVVTDIKSSGEAA